MKKRYKYFSRPPFPEIGRDALPYLEWCDYRDRVIERIAFTLIGIIISGALVLMFL